MPEIYQRTPDLKDSLKGSVYINNNSYSGCDIKVLVHKYDDSDFIKTQIVVLEQKLKDATDEMLGVQSNMEALIHDIPAYKDGTDAYTRKVRQQHRARERYSSLSELCYALQEQLENLKRSELGGASTRVLAECQTLSFSSFRDKQSVRACGTVYPKGFTRGPREIGGSLIFTVFDQSVFYNIQQAHPSDFDAVSYTSVVLDQLPPLDIVISFANEYGSVSRMEIFGVEFVTDGQTMSIEDLILENVVSYVARDWNPMRLVSKRKIDQGSAMLLAEKALSASDLILEDDFKQYKGTSPYQRFQDRRNPFI